MSNENENIDYTTLDYFFNSPEWELLMKMPENTWVNDLKNQRNGKLEAFFPFKKKTIKDPSIYWLCKCDCGSFIMCRADRFRNTPHCGCEDAKNYIGETHGHLTCVGQNTTVSDTGYRTVRLDVQCECGKKFKTTPSKYLNQNCCGMKCPYKMPDEAKEANGARFKKNFYKGTNVQKFGRKESNRNGKSGYLGVWYNEQLGKYLAYITFRGVREDLGYYKTAEMAYQVRISAQDILQSNFLAEIEQDDFVKGNKYLLALIEKVKNKIKDGKDE